MVTILGINSAYHESSACLLRDGNIIAAAEEERFNRIKHGKATVISTLTSNLTSNQNELPVQSIRYCLELGGVNLSQVDQIGFSFLPQRRLLNIEIGEVKEGSWGSKDGENIFYNTIITVPKVLGDIFGTDVQSRFNWISHHQCHAASAYFASPYNKSAILSVDGIGEITTTFLGIGNGKEIKPIKELRYPDSLGFLWEKFSKYLGFEEHDASKVMGLAAYGNPQKYHDKFKSIIQIGNGEFSVDNSRMQFRVDDYDKLEELFGMRRQKGEGIAQRHTDIAASLQLITNETLLEMARYLKNTTKSVNLCMAGGVALNCASNLVMMERSGFDNIFVQPVANDAGTAIGAAYNLWNRTCNQRNPPMESVYLGPEFSNAQILGELKRTNLNYAVEAGISKKAALLLSQGKIGGWFNGRMEMGPRALGNRSLLADPRNPNMREILNIKVKHREPFRPFACSVLESEANKWFDIPMNSPSSKWMLFAFSVKEEKRSIIPAVLHVDGTSRIQIVDNATNPKFHDLISAFGKLTGVPLLLNTSLNDNEPIVCSPRDAINTFKNTGIDFLVLNNYLLRKV